MTGEAKGSTLTFQVGVTHQGADYVLAFTGTTQSPTAMKGTIDVAGNRGDFTATKQ